jgi:pantothenate kinase
VWQGFMMTAEVAPLKRQEAGIRWSHRAHLDNTAMPVLPDDFLARARRLLDGGGRVVLGLAGAPGSGKSTWARTLADAFPGRAVVVPMDGFHLANEELARLGRASRKGAPDTFDAAGYVALLRRLRSARETVYAPQFRREIEQAIAGAIAVPPSMPLVVTEGNYLLLDDGPWAQVRGLLDEAWFVETDEAARREQLVRRHVDHGRTPQAAREWVMRSDEANAALVAGTRARADAVLRW